MQRGLIIALVTVLAACATPPDGSRIQRLPDTAPQVTLSEDERRALVELNARLLAEQERARAHEEALAAQRSAPPPVSFGLNYGWGPSWNHGWTHGWIWTGSRWMWRPRWGVDLWVPLTR